MVVRYPTPSGQIQGRYGVPGDYDDDGIDDPEPGTWSLLAKPMQ